MRRANRRTVVHTATPFVLAALGVLVAWLLSGALGSYYLSLGISVVIFSVSILGLGVVTGSAGMISLCQLTFAAVGAWVVSGLNYIHAPGGVISWMVLGGIAAGAVGILIGLPALRLRGVNLAVVTLGFAAAAQYTLVQIQLPGAAESLQVPRPTGGAFDDQAYFVFCAAALGVCAIVVYFLQSGRWGASWKAVAFSERGTASVGMSVAGAKLTAFAVSATLGGIGGGLLAAQAQTLASSYAPINSLALYVLAIIAGAHFIDMAIFGGILWIAVPAILQALNISQNWGFVIFGVLSIQALTSGATLGGVIRNAWWNRIARQQAARSRGAGAVGDGRGGGSGGDESGGDDGVLADAGAAAERRTLLTVKNLAVVFGQVKALAGVDVTVYENSIMGLIGPNGAGKSTFVDAISGFLPQHTGTVTLAGTELGSLPPTKRARLGLRRTFQQDRVPPTLTVEAYARFVARRRVTTAEIDEVLAFFGCPPARTRLQSVDVGTRRLVEVAANVLSQPKILLLDEPAAGLSHQEHVDLSRRIRQIPRRFGIAVVLIEHDLEMVRSVCQDLTVLDFGEVIATGPHEEVLANPVVMRAYMGETELQP